jgi:hypothetical protein
MDEALAGALTTVELDTSDPQRWFDLTAHVYQEMKDSGSGDDWELFKKSFAAGAEGEYFGSDLVRQFTDYLDYNGRLDLVGRMCDYGEGKAAGEEQEEAA